MRKINFDWSIKCINCDKLILYSKHASFYEAKRLKRNLCKSCAMKSAWDRRGRKSKYDEFIKKGNLFGNLKVVSEKVEKNNIVRCICKCNKIVHCRASNLLDGKSLACRSCRTGDKSSNWKGTKQVPSMFYIKLKSTAENRNIPVSVSMDYIAELFERQQGKCALSGLPLIFEKMSNGVRTKRTASLDRIDSSKGYEEGNVQWVHAHINSMKNSHSDAYFIELCRHVVNHNDNNSFI